MVVRGIDPDLRLVAEAAKRLRVDDPIPISLEGRAQPARFLSTCAAARLIRADGERREPLLFVLAHAKLEGVGDSPGELGHSGQG